ncbi:hypothetical protein CQ010_01340 [Arthrobacter sp. MYb211]|uniref:HAD domain-containing protein n=1 Tax=unclassified Arthrobacter TaxID=235627 RepID=UPI000CFBAF68|nr:MULTISPECIES: HAD domain-containing protein [unclassified Arthrobacter]PRA13318.1 hypothetical protein CQ015_03595 [Arthrobacter sp. MYb221]PRC10515.1 hypothetical protein CQ010_01340 [Arthrobacter sp. MYb211]
MNTIIYLDVDGVINAIRNGTPSQKRTGFTDFKRANINGYQIQWAQELIDHLNALATRDGVTIKWLTTWEHDAAQTLSPQIGLNGQNWEVLTGDQHAWQGRDWWKLKAIQADTATHKPDLAIWIDDDIRLEREAMMWTLTTEGVMVFSPDPQDGLTQDDINTLTAELN